MHYSELGIRMKDYEEVFSFTLMKRIPVIIRVDGRAFHTFTKKRFGREWSMGFVEQMIKAAKAVVDEMDCKFCYCQSDEISFLLTDYKTIHTQPWFGYDGRKLIAISASLTTAVFSRRWDENICFDSRAYSIPQDDAVNYFIWRQRDCTRNAIQMAGREHYSQKQLHGKKGNEIQEMIFQKGVNFDKLPTVRKRGFSIVNGEVDLEIPFFSKDREFVEKHVYVRED